MTRLSHYPISAAHANPQRIWPILKSNPSRRESRRTAIPLTPQRDVEMIDGRMIATSEEPWLKFEDLGAFRPGGFVEIVYRASLFDDPVRPILRFRIGDAAEVDRLLPGPVVGAGIWVGRVPRGTTEIWISPTHHRGRFDFVVEEALPRGGLALWLKALQRSPRYALSAAFYGVPGFLDEYDMNLDWALGFTPLSQFEEWRRTRTRTLDATGIDAPRAQRAKAPAIHVVMTGCGERQASLQSLRAQTYSNWHLHESGELPRSAKDDDLVFVLRAGDQIEPHAFACAIEHAARHPAQHLFYADEIARDENGALTPALKPDWSPLLQTARPYLGRAIFGRVRLLRRNANSPVPQDLASCIGSPEACLPEAIGHLRRMLLIRSAQPRTSARASVETWGAQSSQAAPGASIIIPTKDRGDLLERCIASIFENTRHPPYRIVIVDNGSTAAASRIVLSRLGQDSRVTVLSRPGPFNFAALCNAGAALGTEPVLVFLNDDTSVSSPDWLARLSLAAARPEIGAVGAKLLYPDRRVQHTGVALGIGETVGHFGAGVPEADEGWAGQNSSVHEVSAVTGACLAVERRKFEEVGGFDSENLPIELNDVDLCLRLNQRRWKAISVAEVILSHEESASRGGAKFRLLKVHQKERAYFARRWRRMIRDDPFFHPAFSLFRREQALG